MIGHNLEHILAMNKTWNVNHLIEDIANCFQFYHLSFSKIELPEANHLNRKIKLFLFFSSDLLNNKI